MAKVACTTHRQRLHMGCGFGLQGRCCQSLSVDQSATLHENDMTTQPGVHPDRIDTNNPATSARWAKKLDVTEAQLHEAVKAVGDAAADVEMHLKGSHSTTNADRMEELGDS